MRIALIASITATVPPKRARGVELAVAELAKMLTRLGHVVTVYASGDSTPSGTLHWRFAKAAAHAPPERVLRHLAFAWNDVASHEPPFDIVHAHNAAALVLRGASRVPTVFTLHEDVDEELAEHYAAFPHVRYVATRDEQLERKRSIDIGAVVQQGLDPDDYRPGASVGHYCVFLGDMSAESAPHVAIDAARLARVPLKLAAGEHSAGEEFFAQEMLPRLDAAGAAVEWLGDATGGRATALVQGARALLLPRGSGGPWALQAIASMLMGTPVISLTSGQEELTEDGVTGFVVRDRREMAECLKYVSCIDRARCRDRAIARWSSLRMAQSYEAIYEELLRACAPRPMERRRRTAETARTEPFFTSLFSPLWES